MFYFYLFILGCIGLVGAVLLSGVSLVRKRPFPTWLRVLHLLFLAAPIPFSAFGLFTMTRDARFDEFIYGICFAGILFCCVRGIIRLCRPRSAGEIKNPTAHGPTQDE